MEQTYSACVVVIGNEILSGRTQDVNLQHIAVELGKQGIQVRHARVVPDVEDVIVDTINEVRQQYDYVFTTGGIGPTHDDITADCIARAFGVELVIHPDIAAILQRNPAEPDVMASRMRMARVPANATLIDNPTGGPQGFRVENVFVMAGIPRVMQAMLSTVVPELTPGAVVQARSVTAFLGESQIADALREIQDANPDVDLGSYPFVRDNRYGTSLVVRGTDADRVDAVVRSVEQAVVERGGTPETR